MLHRTDSNHSIQQESKKKKNSDQNELSQGNFNKTCATSKDSDQAAHLCSQIRVFADGTAFCSLQAIQRGMNKNPCHAGWMFRLTLVFAQVTQVIL